MNILCVVGHDDSSTGEVSAVVEIPAGVDKDVVFLTWLRKHNPYFKNKTDKECLAEAIYAWNDYTVPTKLDEVKDILQGWVDKQGHERCWYYPDLFRALADKLGVVPSKAPSLPPRAEFEQGCRRYQDEEFPA